MTISKLILDIKVDILSHYYFKIYIIYINIYMIKIKYLIISLLLLLILFVLNTYYKNIDFFSNINEYNTEIHFITLWRKNNEVEKNRLINKIKDYNNPKIRIIKKIIIKKNDIKRIFKNVGSGGKHSNHNIEIFIIEVPNIYKINKTHDNPGGERVNDIMYNLKKTTRDDYKNYKIAHGSFNIEGANEFFIEYFKYLGEFNNFDEVKNELNNSNIFWLYDRITYNNFGKEKEKDIDLVADSIPAICFILRSTNISNKCYINIGKIQNYLFDLQDFDSHYYPKKWLQNIKHQHLYIKKNDILIPNLETHFMLGLYHKYIHKNGIQNTERQNLLTKMSKKLNYNDNFINLLGYLNIHKYEIKKPIDKDVGFFITKNNQSGKSKDIYIYKNKVYYVYKTKNYYKKDKYLLNLLESSNFTPKILELSDRDLILNVENVGIPINKINPVILKQIDFKEQIYNINKVLKTKNIIHNDITYNNILIKNNNIYLIDFEHAIYNNNNYERSDKNLDYYCETFPVIKNEKNFYEYIKNNDCLSCAGVLQHGGTCVSF